MQLPLFAQNYRIEGSAEGCDGQYAYLGEDKKAPIDSALITQGKFVLENKLEEIKPMMLKIGKNKQLLLLEENTILAERKIVQLEYKGKKFERGNIEISGSQDQKLFLKMNQVLTQEMMTMLAISLSGEENQNNGAMKDSLGVLFLNAKNHTKEVFDSIVYNYTDSYVSALIINDHFAKDRPYQELETLYSRLSDRVKSSNMGHKIRKTLASLHATGIGQVAPNFTLQTPEGQDISLSSLRGKCVLIDFWASWCGPCIRELPNIKKVYEKYHDKGIEIISISLDDKKSNWTKAIEKHQIPWLHVSSLKGWKCPVAKLYNVTGVPAMYLLDAEGRIVSDNARGEALETEVSKLCGQSQGIAFKEGSWKDIQEMAQKENKPIFLDIYTSWCGPCKLMSKQIFTKEEAGEFFNAHFINYKIDAEKGEGIEIAKTYKINSYPTCLFLTHDGKVVSSFIGFKNIKDFMLEGKKAVKNFQILPELLVLETAYNNGKRQKDFLKEYCSKREEFGEKGGKPVYEYVQLLTDEELLSKENTRWIQSVDVYDNKLMQRLTSLLRDNWNTKGKKEMNALNNAIMKMLSTFINQATANNQREMFDQLMEYKAIMNQLASSNNDNGVSASIGGGISYLSTEQIKLSFYNKNRYDNEFTEVFLNYLQQNMTQYPTDSLIRNSNEEELKYSQLMKSDSISQADKKDIKQGRDLMKMFNGVKFQLLAGTLYNAALHYWKLNPSMIETSQKECIDWLRFFYALNRCSDISIPISKKLQEWGCNIEARNMLQDLLEYLSIQEDTQEEIDKVKKALNTIS